MPPLESLVVLSTSALLGLAIVAAVAAWSWNSWLQLRYRQLDHPHADGGPRSDLPVVAARIDLADMKERIKKLEAIAAGVDF